MDKETNAGQQAVNTANGVEGKDAGTSTAQIDVSAKVLELEAKLAKSEKEREIYRSGLLAAKELGKKSKRITEDDLSNPEKLESAIDAKIEERELEKKALREAEEVSEREANLRKENEELRRSMEAFKSSGGGSSAWTGSGHNENSESKPQSYWSDAQKQELRSMYAQRGFFTEKQIDTLVAKAEQIARTNSAQSERGNDMAKTRQY